MSSFEAESAGRLSWRVLLIAFAGYSALALVMTWPLVLHLTSALPHDVGDPVLSATILWWNAHVMPLTRRWIDGSFFYPAGGALALSDHRLGLSLIASPLQWLGLGPVTTYNIVHLATYPLCAIAAHGLAFALTKRHDAAAVCALAFGFSPFRVEHLPHLELLAAFGMPAALWALHLFDQTRRLKWLAAFTAALIVQGLCTSYYLLFFLVFVALWVTWFARWPDWQMFAAIGAGCVACAIVLSPIAVDYWRVHQELGLSRAFGEVVQYSADVTSLVTAASLIAVWGWTAPLNGNENRIFPGLTIMVLAALGIVAALRQPQSWDAGRTLQVGRSGGSNRLRQGSGGPPKLRSKAEGRALRTFRSGVRSASTVLLVAAGVLGVVAAVTAAHGPWVLHLGPITVSGKDIFKTLSLAAAATAASLALSARARDAFRRRSPFAFYLLAAVVLFLCAMGPQPKFLGHKILYEPPYAWLMRLPIFDNAVRAPARFAMPAALALSVAAGLAFSRLTSKGSRRAAAALAVVVAGILADTWVPVMPLAPVPDFWNPARAQGFAAVLELPLDGGAEDIAAMYRTIRHRLPTINGYSGYYPPHYDLLRTALENRDDTALDAMASAGPLLIAANKEYNGDWAGFVRRHPRATPLGDDGRWSFFSLPRNAPSRCDMGSLPIAAASDNRGAIRVAAITDGSSLTWWTSDHPQQVGDMLMLDLGRATVPCAVVMSREGFQALYPRALSVATSLDGAEWTTAFSGKTGGLAIQSALAAPRRPQLAIPLPSSSARYIRLQVEQPLEHEPWVVTDVAVRGKL
jgi:hypothetical protein